jgi:hypothetical protein
MKRLLAPMEAALIEKVEAMEWNHRKDRAEWARQAAQLRAENQETKAQLRAENQETKAQLQDLTAAFQMLAPLWGILPPKKS